MTQRLLRDAHSHFARQFVESVSEQSNTLYYVYAAGHEEYSNWPATPDNSYREVNYQYINMIFGKHVTANDVSHSIPTIEWANGTVFTSYDDYDTTLDSKNYYVVTTEGSDRHVWKCIDNNGNTASNSQPLYTDVSSTLDELYIKSAADGYQWRFMYTISSVQYDKFSSNNFIPVITHDNAVSNAVSGSIDRYIVLNSGNNYNEYATGQFSPDGDSNTTFLKITGTGFSGNNDFYKNCSVYITSGSLAGEIQKIESYTTNTAGKFLTFYSPFSGVPDTSNYFDIQPTLRIVGDGTNASARPIIDTSTNTIANVEVLSRGTGYTQTDLYIEANNMATANMASFRSVKSPFGGHGYDPVRELNSKYVTISTEFANSELGNIPTDNDFRTVGIIKDPLYANVQLTIDTPTADYSVGETATHPTGASGKVTFANSTVIRMTNVLGHFHPSSNITGSTTGATSNIVSILINSDDTRSNVNYFQQSYKFEHTLVSGNPLNEDESVVQLALDNPRGRVLSSNTTHTVLTHVEGTFDTTDTFIVQGNNVGEAHLDSGETVRFKSVIKPDLVNGSGEILYIKNIDQVSRSNTTTETVKLTIEF